MTRIDSLLEIVDALESSDMEELHRRLLALQRLAGVVGLEEWLAQKRCLEAVEDDYAKQIEKASKTELAEAPVSRLLSSDSLTKKLLRTIATHGPASVNKLSQRTSTSSVEVQDTLQGSDLFESEPDGWHLTAKGWALWDETKFKE